MNFKAEEKERYTVLTVQAEKLGGVVSPELKTMFVQLNSKGVKNIIVDMTNTRYCDSSGLSAILVGNRLCKNSEGSFVLCGLQQMVTKLITISQLDNILNIVPTLQEAEDYIVMEDIERDVENE